MKKLYKWASISRMVVCGGAFGLLLGAILCQVGCQSDATDPTTRAQGDPMHWSPDFNNNDSSSGILDFDANGFKKDINDLLNP